MSIKIPPLGTLQAFEAVARRNSFTLAASELSLTASAISHQIAKLEDLVGARLLDRSTAGVRLSSSGEEYLQRISGALSALGAATRDLREGLKNTLYVHSSPSFASLWLMPRLADFALKHPGIALSLSASHIHSDFSTGQIDLDIRYGLPKWPDLQVQALFKEQVLPLASPAFIAQHRIASINDLKAAALIQSTISIVQWRDWLANADSNFEPERFALRFDRAQLALDAAVQGLGIALESSTIAATHIQAKRLVPVFPKLSSSKRAITVEGHFAVYPARSTTSPTVSAFLDWLKVQAKPPKSARTHS